MGRHGVLVRIFNKGVWLRGKPGIGKSFCALKLLYRDHQLVADDIIMLQSRQQQLYGQAHALGLGLLHVRSIGFIEVAKLMSIKQVVRESTVDLIIDLCDRAVDTELVKESFLNCTVPSLKLSIASQTDIAILVERAVKLLFKSSHRARCFF